MHIKKTYLTVLAAILISGCGGGGGGGSPAAPVTPAPTVNLSADPISVLLTETSTLTWSSSNATSCSASGSWSGTKATSGSEAVTISTTGNNTFTLACTGAGGSRSASVTVEGYRNSNGVVVDGYISGADVFIDENDDWTKDSNENSTTSDNDGKFTIKYANGNLVSIGGTDLDSQTLLDNLLITHKLTGHTDFKAVTPVTSVAAFMADAANVNAALGIDSTIDVAIFDPVANKGDGGVNDYLYEKGNQLTVLAYALQNITNDLNTTTETTQDYFKAITEEIEKEFTETTTKVDIETEAFITKALDNVVAAKTLTITDEAKANTTKALSGVMPIIEVKSTNDLTTSVIRFAVSTLQTDIKAIANGTATVETVASYTTDVISYIATDQNIDANEITPDISAIADSASTSEDTAVDINVLANDSYLTSAPITLTTANGSNGSSAVTSNVITYTPNADFNGADTFSYTITQGDKTSSADVSISIEAVNDAPSIDVASTIQAAENQTAVATISVSDVDEDDLTLTLSGTDADSFDLSTDNVLTFKEAPDFETKSSYSITLSLTDGIETVTKDITISITNVNDAPVISSASTFTLDENTTEISGLSLTDLDTTLITYINSTRSIGPSLIQPGPSGWTTNCDDYCFSSDSLSNKDFTPLGNSDGTTLVLTSDTSLSGGIYKIISDISLADGVTLSCLGCTIFGEGSNPLDYKKFKVKGGKLYGINAHFRKVQIAIDETDTNNPGSIDLTYSTIIDAKFAYASGNEAYGKYNLQSNYFENVNTGDTFYIWYPRQINLISNVFYNSGILDIGYRSSDLGGTNANINHNVFNHNDVSALPGSTCCGYVPSYIRLWASYGDTPLNLANNVYLNNNISAFLDITGDSSANIYSSNEYFGVNASLAATRYLDDSDDVTTYSPINVSSPKSYSSNANLATFSPKLNYNPSSGSFTLDTSADFEAFHRSFKYDIKYSDGVTSATKSIQINISNTNDSAPEITSSSSFATAENQTDVGTIVATDSDGSSITYTLSGLDNDSFLISSSGALTFNSAPDYETKSTYSLTVIASDGVNNTNQEITVNVTDVVENSAPVFTSNAAFTAAENQISIGSVVTSDAESDSITYSLSGADASSLAISSSGVLTFSSSPDYETKTSYSASVTANDGTNVTSQAITITITNINDNNPAISSDASFNAAENQTGIGSVSASDADGDSLTYSLSGIDASSLSISSSGVLTFGSSVDYETKTSYSATVSVSDGTNAVSQNITISITNLNDNNPAISSSANFSAAENQTSIGSISASDADGDSLTYSLSGTDASSLSISSSGVLSFNSAPDYEAKASYSATVGVTDGTNAISQNVTINISNLNDNSPAISSNANFSADENQTSAGSISASDADGGTLTYSLSGTDASSLSISSSGVLSFNSAPDYETKASYAATVTVSDGSNTATQNITISIIDKNDNAPIITSDAVFAVNENQTAAGTITATDADSSSLTYAISGTDASSLSISSSGVLTFGSAPDYETKTSYAITANVSDNTDTTSQNVTININNLNDNNPAISSGASFSPNENQTSIGSVSASDADGDSLTYSLSGTDASSLAISSSGVLTFGSAPDYEVKNSYAVTVGVTDGTNAVSQNITVGVVNLNDNNPAISSSASFSAAENQTAIGSVSAADADGDSLTYSLSGTDASSLAISSSGVLTFINSPDFEAKSSYSAIIGLTDGTNAVSQNITITVTDVTDTYKISGTAYASRYMTLDSDVPNTTNHSSSSNAYGSAQAIQNPVIVIGHTGNDTDRDGNSTTDAYDLYKVTLTNNMYVRLQVAEYSEGVKDLDLYLYETNGNARNFSYATGSTEGDEYIDLPSSGTILIQVNPVNGSSKYKLTLGQRVIPASFSTPYNYEHFYTPNQFIETKISKSGKPQDISSVEKNRVISAVDQINSKSVWNERGLLRFNINNSRKMQNINDIDSKDTNLIISKEQEDYLYHWKLQHKLQSIFPSINFGFNYKVETLENFSKDPDYSVQWNFLAINAEAGLNAVGQEVKDIVVAVIDTGSPPTNSAAWGATNFISGGIDFVNYDTDPTDIDASLSYVSSGRLVRSHGTHVGSTIGAKNDGNYTNGFGVKVLPIKAIEPGVITSGLYSVVQAIKFASGAANDSNTVPPSSEGPVKVINMSLRFPGLSSCPASLQNAINYAVSQGISVVAAAGNDQLSDANNTMFPAGCSNVISVAALDEKGTRAEYSQINSTVDIAAPGGGSNPGIPAWVASGSMGYMSGTSMAAPMVSGVIANMYSLDSGLTPAEVDIYITGSNFSNDIGDSGRDNSYGYGAIDFSKAAAAVISGEGLSKTYAYASPNVIDFGFSTTSINIILTKIGNGTLSVNNLAADNPTGLTYNSSVDSSGFGTYTINLDRSDLPNGTYANVMYFNMSDGTSPASAIYYDKGSVPSRLDVGKVFVGLYNSSNSLVASGNLDMDGSLAFETTGTVPIGNYYYVISTDIDNDGLLCTAGEICEIYPTSDKSERYISIIDSAVTGDSVLLRAISSGSSSLSTSSEFKSSSTTKEFRLPNNKSSSIFELEKPVEFESLASFEGKPVQDR